MFENIRISPATEEKWGRLVRTWATGVSEFQAVAIDRLPVPRSLAELKAQCVLVGVEITVPASITGLVVVQQGPETFVLRLSSKKMILDAQAEPAGSYKIPAFYASFCGPLTIPAGQEEKFQALRIGDYSIGTCQ